MGTVIPEHFQLAYMPSKTQIKITYRAPPLASLQQSKGTPQHTATAFAVPIKWLYKREPSHARHIYNYA